VDFRDASRGTMRVRRFVLLGAWLSAFAAMALGQQQVLGPFVPVAPSAFLQQEMTSAVKTQGITVDAGAGDEVPRMMQVGDAGFWDTIKSGAKSVGNFLKDNVQVSGSVDLGGAGSLSFGAGGDSPRPVEFPAPRPAVIEPPQPLPQIPPMPDPVPIQPVTPIVFGKCAEMDSDCKTPVLRVDPINANSDPVDQSLLKQLKEVHAATHRHVRGIEREENWIASVETVMKKYTTKIKQVDEHIKNEHKLVEELNKKKHEVRNLIKQKKMEMQLKAAEADVKELQDEMDQIADQEKQFEDDKRLLRIKQKQLKRMVREAESARKDTSSADLPGEVESSVDPPGGRRGRRKRRDGEPGGGKSRRGKNHGNEAPREPGARGGAEGRRGPNARGGENQRGPEPPRGPPGRPRGRPDALQRPELRRPNEPGNMARGRPNPR